MGNPRGLKWWQTVMPEILPRLGEEDASLFESEVEYQSRQVFRDIPRGAIHADLFRDNVLFEDAHISGVIDFYFACTDVLLYDVAICVNYWCVKEGGALDGERAHALLTAYASVRAFTQDEHGAWPIMLRAAALRFWISRLYDFHLPRPGELTHAKDPAHFRAILQHHVRRGDRLPGLPL